MTKIIGVSGKMGSGKSIFAEAFPIAIKALKAELGVQILYYGSLSDPLKSDVSESTGIKRLTPLSWGSMYDVNGAMYDYSHTDKSTHLASKGMTLGKYLQVYGEWMRSEDPFVLAKRTLNKIPSVDIAIIDGVRHIEDVQAINATGGKVIRIVRDDIQSLNDGRESTHSSETELDDISMTEVVNRTVRLIPRYGAEVIRGCAVNNMVEEIIKQYKEILDVK